MEKTLQEQLVELKSQLETSLTEKAKSEIALQIKSLEEKMKPVEEKAVAEVCGSSIVIDRHS